MNSKEEERVNEKSAFGFKAEDIFWRIKFKLYKDHTIEKNNQKNKYDIDYILINKDGKVVAYFDLEARRRSLKPLIKRYGTIHVLKENLIAREKTGKISTPKKVEFYKEHPDDSFHLSWAGAPLSIEYPEMYLITGREVIASPVIDTVDEYGTPIKAFDVPTFQAVDGNTLIKAIVDTVDKKSELKDKQLAWGDNLGKVCGNIN